MGKERGRVRERGGEGFAILEESIKEDFGGDNRVRRSGFEGIEGLHGSSVRKSHICNLHMF